MLMPRGFALSLSTRAFHLGSVRVSKQHDRADKQVCVHDGCFLRKALAYRTLGSYVWRD